MLEATAVIELLSILILSIDNDGTFVSVLNTPCEPV